MPKGKGTYGSKMGRPPKKGTKKKDVFPDYDYNPLDDY